MPRIRPKRVHKKNLEYSKRFRTRRHQIHEDLCHPEKFESLPVDPDLPGCGQFLCIECSRYFISETALQTHLKGKVHKKRVKELKEVPYTQQEAEMAAGMTN